MYVCMYMYKGMYTRICWSIEKGTSIEIDKLRRITRDSCIPSLYKRYPKSKSNDIVSSRVGKLIDFGIKIKI